MQIDWASTTAELDLSGGALLPRLVTDEQAAALRDMYDDDRFRSTVDMARHRFGAAAVRKASLIEPGQRTAVEDATEADRAPASNGSGS